MDKIIVHSYDIFDTILSRLHVDPKSIFALVEHHYPYPDFKKIRILAEQTSNGTLDDIYRRFCEITQISQEEAEKIKEFEIKTELEQVFPIIQNMDKIRDGDILISDTYYDETLIMRILKQAGLEKTVKVFVSPSGKHTGKIWEDLKKEYEIALHLGDNLHSDVSSPKLAGIPATLYEESKYSSMEQGTIFFGQLPLANLMRTLRLLNPYPEYTPHYFIWNEQAQLNVPILILTCLYLNNFCKKFEKKRILFTMRDCCHLINIFKALFPNYESIKFYSSRSVYRHPTKPYVDYVKSIYTSNSVIVDSQGTGTTCIDFFTKHLQTIPDFLVIVGQPTQHKIHQLSSGFTDKIERLNYDIHGTLIDYTEEGPVLLEPEYDLEYVKPAHACMNKCLELIKHYTFGEYSNELFDFLLSILESSIYIAHYVKHIERHKPF